MNDATPLEPCLEPADRQELANLAFLRTRIDDMLQRGFLSDEARDVLLAEAEARRNEIETRGLAEAAYRRSLRAQTSPPDEAVRCARRAIELWPGRADAWSLAIDLEARLGRYDQAMALCTRPDCPLGDSAARVAELSARQERAAEEAALTAARARDAQALDGLLADAHAAARVCRDDDAVASCRRYLASRPADLGAMALMAAAFDRLGRLEEALDVYRELRSRQPGHGAWVRRITELREKIEARAAAEASRYDPKVVFVDELEVVEATGSPAAATHAHPPRPGVSWRSIAGEFLKEHWQKLILCLAVLLIVVSSTVGAHHLLGERLLWSRAGQCTLALVYTATFAVFGYGLVRWGAVRAGQIMLLTTLFVVPVNFSLAGELRLLIVPTTTHLLILGAVLAVLLGLVMLIDRTLNPRGELIFPFGFFALSAFDATAARGVPFGWGFIALIASAWVFLAAVWGLNVRLRRGEPSDERRDFAYFALGLLTYAFLFFAYRSGVFVLQLIPRSPALMAVPVMLTAIACAHTAYSLPRFERDPRRIHLLRLAGHTLAGLGLALALAHPPVRSALLSGNALAVSLLGLGLFAASLGASRHPAYLYAAFGTLVIAYFGTYTFVRDLVDQYLVLAGHALGYPGRLPAAFRSLNGIVFNLLLAALAVFFARRWEDRRLARHCHAIGLPLAVACCLFSLLERKAAVLCLPAYAVLFAVGAYHFAAPRLLYLAALSGAGGAVVASLLVPGVTGGERAFGAAAIGLVYWCLAQTLKRLRVREDYRAPLVHAALGLAGAALVAATVVVAAPQPLSVFAIATFFAVGLLAALVSFDVRRPAPAYLAVGCAVGGSLLLSVALNGQRLYEVSTARWALLAGSGAAVLCALGAITGRGSARPWHRTWSSARDWFFHPHGGMREIYAWSFLHVGLLQWLVCLGACAVLTGIQVDRPDARSLAWLATSLGLCALSAGLLASVHRTRPFAYATVALGAAAFGAGLLGGLIAASAHGLPSALAIGYAAIALLFYQAGARLPDDRGRLAGLYRDALLQGALFAVVVAWTLCATDWTHFGNAATALALASFALVGLAAAYPWRIVAHGAIASALGSWLCAFDLFTGEPFFKAWLSSLLAVFGLSLVIAADAVRAVAWRRAAETTGRSRAFLEALPDFATAAVLFAALLGALRLVADLPLIVTLAPAALALLWLTRFRRDDVLVYLGLVSGIAATLCLCVWLRDGGDGGLTLAWMAAAASATALGLRIAGFVCRRTRAGEFYARPCLQLAIPLVLAVLALALGARVVSRAAYPVAAAALLVNAIASLSLAAAWRRAGLTYVAIASVVAATYVTLLSLGEPSSEKVYILGLVAAIEGLLLWLAGTVGQALGVDRRAGIDARPFFVSALVLIAFAAPPGHVSPVTMLLVGLGCLLLIRPFPSALWIYPAMAAFGSALGYGPLARTAAELDMLVALGGAFVLWLAGFGADRFGHSLCRRLRIADRGYAFALYNTAVLSAVLAVGIRAWLTGWEATPLTAHVGLWLGVALFALLMLRPYPWRGWVHIALASLSAAIAIRVYLMVTPRVLWLPVGLAFANVWLLAGRAVERFEGPLCDRLGIRRGRYAEVPMSWSFGLFALMLVPVGIFFIFAVAATLLGGTVVDSDRELTWWALLASLLFAAAYIDRASLVPRGRFLDVGLLIVPLAVGWWLGVSIAPTARALHLDPLAYFPEVTAVLALGLAVAGARMRLEWLGPAAARYNNLLGAHAWWVATCELALAMLLTFGAVAPATAAVFITAAITFGILTVSRKTPGFAYAGGAAWIVAVECLWLIGLVRLRWLAAPSLAWTDLAGSDALAGVMTSGAVAAVLALLAFASLCRARPHEADADQSFGAAAARALEIVALTTTGVAAGVALIMSGEAIHAGAQWLGVGTLLGATLVLLLLAGRWRAEWLVYMAQAALVASYFVYRAAFPQPVWTDALVLVALGYLDFAISELMGRLGLTLFARPTLYFSLAMPVLPLLLALWHGQADEVSLFLVGATATFYAIACTWLRNKPLGYASAVLYNAFLWVAWARVGWRLADHPQFFFIPVGFSVILFAEVNRRELGRTYANTLRSVGLVVIYLSLALPIWQFESFGAWLALLLLSLAGVFAGIGLHVQSFLWLGLACFFLDVVYQLGRVGMEHALAKWAIMLALGVLLILFVALNEKKRIVLVMRGYLEQVREWE